jgi:hypothetical protein
MPRILFDFYSFILQNFIGIWIDSFSLAAYSIFKVMIFFE